MKRMYLLLRYVFLFCLANCLFSYTQAQEKQLFSDQQLMQADVEVKHAPEEIIRQIIQNIHRHNQELNAPTEVFKAPVHPVADSHTMLAGFAYAVSGGYGSFYSCFGYEVNNVSSLRVFESPFNPNNTWDLYPEGWTLRVRSGAWTGNEWHVITTLHRTGDQNTYFGLRLAYDFASKSLRIIGTGKSSNILPPDMTYNFKTKKLYGIIDKRLLSISLSDTVVRVIDTIKMEEGYALPAAANFMTIACDTAGVLYAMTGGSSSSNRKMYRLNPNTARASLVGSFFGNLNTYLSPMTFHRKTNELYWNEVTAAEKLVMNKVSTDSANYLTITLINELGIQSAGLFHHVYENNIPQPEDVSNIIMKSNDSNPLKVELSWNNPSLNYHGMPLTSLKKIYIYRGLTSTDYTLIDSVYTTEAGKRMSYSRIEENFGTYFYGLRAVGENNTLSPTVAGRDVFCFQLNLPYQYGFENVENHIPISYYNKDSLDIKCTSDVHSGIYSCKIKDKSFSRILINGVPVKKGSVYKIDVYAKNSAIGQYTPKMVSCWIDSFIASDTVYLDWKKLSFYYLADKTDRLPFKIQASTAINNIFLDDISISEEYPNTVPNICTDITANASANGALSADLVFKTPSISAGDDILKSIKGVYVEASTSSSFSIAIIDTIPLNVIGEWASGTVKVSTKGRWYFRLKAYSEHGPSPYYSKSAWSNYIGPDTVLPAPTMLEPDVESNGSVLIKWKKLAEKGKNGGYFDGILSGYMVCISPGKTKKTDTIIVTDTICMAEGYPLNYYTITVSGMRNSKYLGDVSTSSSIMGARGNTKLLRNSIITTYLTSNFFNISTSSNSGISQTIYTKEQIGEVCVIDTLILFVKTANTKAVSKRIKIHFSYNDDTCYFSYSCDPRRTFVSYKGPKSKQVFDDTITFEPGEYMLKIPVTPFFYEHKEDLVITVIKPKTTGVSQAINVRAYASQGKTYLITLTSNSIDTDTIPDVHAITTDGVRYIMTPAMLITKKLNLGKITGTIKSKRNGALLSGATIHVSTPPNGTGTPISYSFDANELGGFSFDQLLSNQYILRFSCEGYADSTVLMNIEEGNTYLFAIELDDATKLRISGKIKDVKNQNLEGVVVCLSGLSTYYDTTDNSGEYIFDNVYGSTVYSIDYHKLHYKNTIKEYAFGKQDSVLPLLVLENTPYPVRFVQSLPSVPNMEIQWNKPIHGFTDLHTLKWCADSAATAGIGAGSKEFIAAVQFLPEDLQDIKNQNQPLTAVRFYITDKSAFVRLKIYEGEMASTLLYEKDLGNNRLGWNNVVLEKPLYVNPEKELWLSVQVNSGYNFYPMGVDQGPRVRTKGERIFYDGSWKTISELSSGSLSVNWAIKGIFGTVIETNPAEGYQVYRGLAGDEANVDKWTKVNTNTITNLSFIDPTWVNAPFGIYRYAVKTDWKNNNLSEAIFSQKTNKDMEFCIGIKTNTNNGVKEGIEVCMTSINLEKPVKRILYTNTEGEVFFDMVWRGQYSFEIKKNNHATLRIQNFSVNKDTLISLPNLQEVQAMPNITKVSTTKKDVKIDWSMKNPNSWSDDVESYTKFAIENIGEYNMLNKTGKYGISGVIWANNSAKQAFIVFDALATSPALKPLDWGGKDGSQCFASFAAVSGSNSDIIYRPISTGGGILSFWGKGIGYQNKQEEMQVLVSSTSNNPSDFITSSLGTVTLSQEWKEYSVQIADNIKYVGIKNISSGTFCLLIDDLEFVHNSDFGIAEPLSFELYLDDNKVSDADSKQTSFIFENLSSGTHILGIKAVYASGKSDMATTNIRIVEIEDHANKEIKVYPNPSSDGIFYISLAQEANIAMYTSDGSFIKLQKLSEGEHTLDISGYAKGIYYLKVQTHSVSKVLKLVK